MKKRSKRYAESAKNLSADKAYSLKDAIALLKAMKMTKFDQSVDLHFALNVDPKKAEQMIRGTVILPHGTGKKVRVAVFCRGEHERDAKNAGADIVGGQELIDKVAGGFLDFDCVIATPEMMKDLSRLGKVLGPRGLMPSPKTGTVTNDIAKAIEDVKRGKVEYRVDKQGGIHLSVGKISFDQDKLYDNAQCVINAIVEAKPGTVKGKFVRSLYASTSMNPGLKIEL
ncbi:MAG TPA: 50S ribosomal protein L1 [Candidatus Omnitrophota bacterium]|nr:50S ribosomal protein L1 [Candidatus Omnitrophota bacterium]HQJ15985.1 50S ribosomal protein L1 [Candidatus Omnitrophota bacterium]